MIWARVLASASLLIAAGLAVLVLAEFRYGTGAGCEIHGELTPSALKEVIEKCDDDGSYGMSYIEEYGLGGLIREGLPGSLAFVGLVAALSRRGTASLLIRVSAGFSLLYMLIHYFPFQGLTVFGQVIFLIPTVLLAAAAILHYRALTTRGRGTGPAP